MLLAICHLMNNIIYRGEFPKILKISKIYPVQKPGKDPMETASWRPIANIPTTEKIIEEVLKIQMMKHF